MTCLCCGAVVTPLDAALTKKFVNRGSQTYYCIGCLAEKFAVSRALLLEKAREFQRAGCALFTGLQL